jgi:hypothetical protein
LIACANASARPYSSATSIACDDRGCAAMSVAGPGQTFAPRRMRFARRASLRTETHLYWHGRGRRMAFGGTSTTWQRRDGAERSSGIMRARMTERASHGGGVVTIETAANPITVASGVAGRMRGLVADLVAHGFHGHITCLASGHMPGSLHHSGEACDFAQLSRNRVATGAGIMYHAHEIIAAHGLRDGCSFHDCGHVDDGRMSVARAQWIPHVRHYARRYLGHRGYRTARRSWQ